MRNSPPISWPARWPSPAAAAGTLLGLADHLEARLPGTGRRCWTGSSPGTRREIIAAATALLDPDEARAAEAKVLDRAGRLTPGGLRAAIARAVMEVAPEKARERREARRGTPGWSGGPRTPATPR